MTAHQRVGIKKRTHETKHWQAIQDPNVRKLVAALRRCWTKLGPIERGVKLCKLSALGCSTRGLQDAIGQSATSIRRHMVLANLPEEYRNAIMAGAPAKKILAKKADDDCQRRQWARVIEDQRTGSWSDKAATTILDFCRAKVGQSKQPILISDLPEFLGSVKMYLSDFGLPHRRYAWPSKNLGWKALIRETRPFKEKDAFWLAHYGEWLANILTARFPERPIWERGLQKAEDRKKELLPVRTPIQAYHDRLDRLAEISKGPARRTY